VSFRIQNNIAAMDAHRQLEISGNSLTKSLERLSSGYRINSASDDAAGLAISNNFTANIASFNVASQNASQANSLLQVAEGGMSQITNMLTRLKELSTQAASANIGNTERVQINAEGNALISEIDRIANSTKYGSTNLLDGSFGASMTDTVAPLSGAMVTGTNNYQKIVAIAGTALSTATVAAIGSSVTSGAWYLTSTGASSAVVIANNTQVSAATMRETAVVGGAGLSAATSLTFANLGITMTYTAATDLTTTMSVQANAAMTTAIVSNMIVERSGLTSIDVNNADAGTYTFAGSTSTAMTLGNGTITQTVAYTGAGSANFNLLGISFNIGSNYDKDVINGMNFTVTNSGGSGAVFQIGAENNTENRISLSIGNVTTGANGLNLQADQLTSQSGAQTMLDTIDTAVSLVSSKDGEIGASMNRLGYAAANLSTTIENTQAAESVIKDVDMASEMTNFTKNQILQQAGTAMLSQANQAPQLILSLFK
jgi:flagellin